REAPQSWLEFSVELYLLETDPEQHHQLGQRPPLPRCLRARPEASLQPCPYLRTTVSIPGWRNAVGRARSLRRLGPERIPDPGERGGPIGHTIQRPPDPPSQPPFERIGGVEAGRQAGRVRARAQSVLRHHRIPGLAKSIHG